MFAPNTQKYETIYHRKKSQDYYFQLIHKNYRTNISQ